MKFSNWIVSAEGGSFILVHIIRIIWKVDNSDTGVATNEVRSAQNDDAIFELLRIGNYNRSYYKIPLRWSLHTQRV